MGEKKSLFKKQSNNSKDFKSNIPIFKISSATTSLIGSSSAEP